MRSRILAAIVAVALLAVVALAAPLAVRLGHDVRMQSIARLERAALNTSARVPDRIDSNTAISIPELASDGELSVYDDRGRRIAGEGPAVADAAVRRALAGHTSSGELAGSLVVGVPVVRHLQVVAAVRAGEALSVTDAQLRRQRVNIVLFALAAIAIAVIVGLALSSRLARPLARLRNAAGRLGHGDFTARAPRSGIGQVDDVAQALDDTAGRLGDLIERERSFSAHASHQLRTPLASLRLAIEAELAQPRADPTAALHEVLTQVDRLEHTIRELLLLARGTAERGPVDIDRVVRDAEARWQNRLAAAARPIRVRILDQELSRAPVNGSSAALGQVLDVLLDNALQHGAGTVTITVRAGSGGGTVIAVQDEGPGMERDLDEQLMTPPAGGHGYGLAFAVALARAEGAVLRVANRGPKPVFELTVV